MRLRAALPGVAWAWFGVLGLAVAGPLLGAGYLLLLDFPSGPLWPDLTLLPLPSSGDLGNGTPLAAVHRALVWIHPYVRDKVFLLAPIVLGGVGAFRLARRRLRLDLLPALFGATLFVVNPFVRDRYLAGHLHLVLGVALLPWALSPVHDTLAGRTERAGLRMGLWFAVLAAVDVHVAGMYGLVVAVAIAAAPRRRLALAGSTLALAAAFSAYWVIPNLFTVPGADIGPGDLEAYASRPQGYPVLASLLSMHGFWRNEFPPLAERVPILYLLLVPILGLVAAGAARLLTRGEDRRFAGVLTGTAVLALLLAAGTSFPPTAGAFRWLFDHMPLFGVYREPQKFLALVVLAYSVFGAAGLHDVLTGRGRRFVHVSSLLAVAAVVAYGAGMFWGFGGEARLSQYPDAWAGADRRMDEVGAGRMLVLPWHLYAVWTFSDGRIVANPATSFFSREVLAGGETGFEIPPQSPDPFRRYVSAILEQRDEIESFGHLVAPLDVRFVAWHREVDWETYGLLEDQPDLRVLYRSREITVYENLAWRGSVVGLSPGERLGSPTELIGSRDEDEVTSELRSAPPLAPRQDDDFPALARALPSWRTVGAEVSAPFVSTGDRCTDGWRLGESRPECHLGAVAAFPTPDGPESLWRPVAGEGVVGLAVSALALIVALVYIRTHRTSPIPASERDGSSDPRAGDGTEGAARTQG